MMKFVTFYFTSFACVTTAIFSFQTHKKNYELSGINENVTNYQQGFTRKRQKIEDKPFGNLRKDFQTVCPIKITIDHTLYQKFKEFGQEDIVQWAMKHMKTVDDTYRTTDFDMDGQPDGIRIWVKDFAVWTTTDEPGYTLSKTPIQDMDGLFDYTEDFMKMEAKNLCANVLLTGHNFIQGLGLELLRTNTSGICTLWNPVVITVRLDWIGSQYPENSSDFLFEQVLIHEIGHAFGTAHDPETSECSPTPEKLGGYVMIGRDISYNETNGHKFSPCSRREISEKFKLYGRSCFEYENEFDHCGNGFVDAPDEECDCGGIQHCYKIDLCCTPRGGHNDDKQCTYRRKLNATCSYREDKCCTPVCQIYPASYHRRCNADDVCKIPSYCDGKRKYCPPSKNLPDGTQCPGRIGVCRNGVCEDVICRASKMERCRSVSYEGSCQYCCLYRGKCLPAKIWGILNETEQSIHLPDGERCYLDLAVGLGVCKDGQCELHDDDVVTNAQCALENEKRKRNWHFNHDMFGYFGLVTIFLVVIVGIPLFSFVSCKTYQNVVKGDFARRVKVEKISLAENVRVP